MSPKGFDLDFDQDIEGMRPRQAKQAVEETVNVTAEELRDLKDSKRFERYNDRASGQETDDAPIPGGPTDDVIHMLETPASQWGEDELAEAEEWANYGRRTLPQFGADEGEPLRPNADDGADIHKGEMALLTWGFDMNTEDNYP